jgi:hypothetical protein
MLDDEVSLRFVGELYLEINPANSLYDCVEKAIM